jgi:hypothetical protein
MGYLGVFLRAHQLGQEAANDVKCKCNLNTKAGQTKFMEEAYELVEAYSQLGRYSYIGGELMRMKNPDAAVNKYDNAVSDGIKSVMNKRMKAKSRK